MTKNYFSSVIVRTIFVALFFILPFCSNAQSWQWVKTAGGTGSDKGIDIDIDKYGNEYICGYYNSNSSAGDVSFGIYDAPLDFGKEGFLAKIDKYGTWQWVRSAMGGWDERALGMCVDRVNDYVYVTGTCWGYTDFGSCTGTTFPGSGDNIFVGKFDLNGTCQWLIGAGGDYDDHGYDLVTDKQGNVYLTGFIGDTYASGAVVATFGSINVPIPLGDSLGFVSKISPSGVFQWVRTFQATDGERDNRIAIDSSANIYITGGFRGTKPFGTATGVSNGGRDIFVLKYDSSGNQLWLRTAGGVLDDRANSITVDIEQDAYITGELRDVVVFGSDTVNNNGSPNGRDIFVAKITQSGSWSWAKKAGSNAGSDRGNRISANKKDLLFVTGEFKGNASFGAADTLINTGDSVQIFVAAIDTAGKWQWAIQAGSTIEDRGAGIVADDSCDVYTTGYYELTASFNSMNITSTGRKEIYVASIPNACVYASVDENSFSNINYYPNPSNGNVTIDLGKTYENFTVQVHNVMGQLIQSKKYESTNKINLSIDQPNGIYFIRLITKQGESITLKVIKG